MPDPSATATLRITKPGAEATMIVAAVANLAQVEPTSGGVFRLTFMLTGPDSVSGVLSAHLCQSGHRDWADYVTVQVDGVRDWTRKSPADGTL